MASRFLVRESTKAFRSLVFGSWAGANAARHARRMAETERRASWEFAEDTRGIFLRGEGSIGPFLRFAST